MGGVITQPAADLAESYWWAELSEGVSLALAGWQGDSKMALTSAGVNMAEQDCENGFHQCPSPQRKSQLPPVSLEGTF